MEDEHNPTNAMSYKFLIGILVLLLALTAATIGVSRINLGQMNIWAALLIATAKSSLVVLFFMQLKVESLAIKASFISALCFVAILIGFIFWDIVYRYH